jgi:DNA polymerase III delta prime subunit
VSDLLTKITKTTDRKPPRCIIYGPPGVGKTTLAASAPGAIFIRTEEGTEGMEANCLPMCEKWEDCLAQLTALATEDHQFKTLVIDTLDGIERVIWKATAKANNKENIEDIPYGKGMILCLDLWLKLVAGLTYLRNHRGMRVVLLAHSTVRKVISPDAADYDRWQPRLHDRALGLLVEWADLIAFARMETLTKTTDSGRVQGVATGRRILCVQDAAQYLAKNRYGLTENINLTWAELARSLKDPL